MWGAALTPDLCSPPPGERSNEAHSCNITERALTMLITSSLARTGSQPTRLGNALFWPGWSRRGRQLATEVTGERASEPGWGGARCGDPQQRRK